MSDHLPECGQYCDGKPPKCRGGDCTLCDEVDCICPALRACENRVREEERLRAQLIAKEELRTTAESFDDYDYYMFAKEQYKDCYDRISKALRPSP